LQYNVISQNNKHVHRGISITCDQWDTQTGSLDGFLLSDFDRIPPWQQQTGSGIPERFLMWRAWFVDGLRLADVGPVDFGRCAHRSPSSGRPLTVCWRYCGKRLESISHAMPCIGDRSETAPSPLRRHVVKWSKNDWTNLARHKCVTCETRRRRIPNGLGQSISAVFHHGGSKPELVFQSGLRCGGRDLSTDCDWPSSKSGKSYAAYHGARWLHEKFDN